MREEGWVPESLRANALAAFHDAKKTPFPSSTSNDARFAAPGTSSSSRSSSCGTSLLQVPAADRNVQGTVRINIGGLMFEVSSEVLKRDRGSLLAQLCPSSSSAPLLILPDSAGIYYFDRDW
jgi:BTB/POZ domain